MTSSSLNFKLLMSFMWKVGGRYTVLSKKKKKKKKERRKEKKRKLNNSSEDGWPFHFLVFLFKYLRFRL